MESYEMMPPRFQIWNQKENGGTSWQVFNGLKCIEKSKKWSVMLKAIHIQQSIQWVGQWYTLHSVRRKAMPHTIMFHYVYDYSSQEEACLPYHCLCFWYLCNRICFVNRKSRNSSQKLSRVTAPKTSICL